MGLNRPPGGGRSCYLSKSRSLDGAPGGSQVNKIPVPYDMLPVCGNTLIITKEKSPIAKSKNKYDSQRIYLGYAYDELA